MRLEEIASRRVYTLNPAEPIARALALMQEKGIQHLPVVRGRTPLGMISDHDVLEHVGWMKATSRRAMAPSTRVEKIMHSPMVSMSSDEPIEKAAQMMLHKHIGAIPLVDQERLVGITTETDFIRFVAEPNELLTDEQRARPCSDVMSTEVISVEPGDATLETYRLMRNKRVRHLPVIENGKLVGIISDRDILADRPAKEAK